MEEVRLMNIGEEANYHKMHRAKPDFLAIILTVGIGGLIYGYHSGIDYDYLLPNLDELFEDGSEITYMAFVVAGCFVAFPIGISFGPFAIGEPCTALEQTEISFFICCNLFIIGSVIGAMAFHFVMVATARLFISIGIGVTLYCSPIYIAEVSPLKLRGAFISTFYLFVAGGQLLAYLVSKVLFYVPYSWRLMVALVGVIAFYQYHLAKSLFPESHSRSYAHVVLIGRMTLDHRPRTWEFRSFVCTCCILAQQFVGMHMVLYSSPRILQLAGYTADNLYSLVIPCHSALGCLITITFVDSWGRRKLLFVSIFGILVSLSILTYAATVYEAIIPVKSMPEAANISTSLSPVVSPLLEGVSKAPYVYGGTTVNEGIFMEFKQQNASLYRLKVDGLCLFPLVALQSYFFSYSLGMGVVPWIINSESYPTRYNNGLFSSTFSLAASYLWDLFTPIIFDIYAFSSIMFLHCIVSFVIGTFIFLYVPETKGVQVENDGVKIFHMWGLSKVTEDKAYTKNPDETQISHDLEKSLLS